MKSKIKHDNNYQIYQSKFYKKSDFHRFKCLLFKRLNTYEGLNMMTLWV